MLNALDVKRLTDENFKNFRNELLNDVLKNIRESIKLGNYYCLYRYHEKCTYMDFKDIEDQLKALGYKVKVEDPTIKESVGDIGSRVTFVKYKGYREILIEWGNI